MLVNLCESSLGVQVLRNGGVIYCFKLQIFGGSQWNGEFFFKDLPDVGGILLILVRVDESRVDSHGESAEALVIGIMPVVDPGLVGNLVIFILFLSGFRGGDGIPSTDGAKVASDKGCPLLVVGAFEHGDMADERGGSVGHFGRGLVLG